MVESGQPGIVVANERYVVGHAQASFLENVQRSDGRQVVGHEDRGGEHGGSEQLGGSPAAPAGRARAPDPVGFSWAPPASSSSESTEPAMIRPSVRSCRGASSPLASLS